MSTNNKLINHKTISDKITSHKFTKHVNSKVPLVYLRNLVPPLHSKGWRNMAVRRAVKYALQNEAVKLLPTERVRFCLRHRIDGAKA